MSTDKKRFLLNIVLVSLGCSSCRKQKLSSVCQPKQKLRAPTYQKHKKDLYSSSSSSSSTSSSKITAKQSPNDHENHDTPNTFSPAVDSTPPHFFSDTGSNMRHLLGSRIEDSGSLDSTPPHFFSDTGSSMRHCSGAVRGFGRVGDESVAVEKDSDDPYLDFRHSMLQKILEKQIYSKDDLRQLLDCFLQLNSPYYHGVIIKAFTEIWNGVFSMRSNTTTGAEKQVHYYYGC
ncbi:TRANSCRIPTION REPRESSOR OFP7-RELATED [Salix purpurea]|uniref:Transcription repressor n=1 Tax=Salix purpurea TaxID=77065 RepID=A0A9Q0T2T7_SALPP|nr:TRANSCRIPTION REPRESSOR OFP7-RELATED [Salix purpurea]